MFTIPDPMSAMASLDQAAMRKYAIHADPPKLKRHIRTVEAIARDRRTLIEMGEEEAAEGATNYLRHALVDVLLVQPLRFEDHLKKCEVLARYARFLSEPAWLLQPMIDLVLQIDWSVLSATPAQKTRAWAVISVSRAPSQHAA